MSSDRTCHSQPQSSGRAPGLGGGHEEGADFRDKGAKIEAPKVVRGERRNRENRGAVCAKWGDVEEGVSLPADEGVWQRCDLPQQRPAESSAIT